MLVDLVLVADAGEKAAALQREATAEGERLEERLLHFDFVFRRKRGDELSAEVRVNIAAEPQLGLGETEAAPRRPDFASRRREAGDLVGLRILLDACCGALQDRRNFRIESCRTLSARLRLRFQAIDALLQLLVLLGGLRMRRHRRRGERRGAQHAAKHECLP